MSRELDLVVYGASGYTGRLVAEYLRDRHGTAGSFRWGIAGRDRQKLNATRDSLGGGVSFPILIAHSNDLDSLQQMARRTRAVLTTVGPYQRFGSELVKACALTGTDYLDLCGEPAWMRSMIDRHDARARLSGARILFSCGFDSIPFEVGVQVLQRDALRRSGAPYAGVSARVTSVRPAGATYSGGTFESLRESHRAARQDAAVAQLLADPFALTPGYRGVAQPDAVEPKYDADVDAWVAPFIMATINTKNVHRSNLLQSNLYGRDFRYDEMVVAGKGQAGEAAAHTIAAGLKSVFEQNGPTPGDGPTPEQRKASSYQVTFTGRHADGRTGRCIVSGDRDAGYGSTAKIVCETAICLLEQGAEVAPGIWTPGAALGERLAGALSRHAGLTFDVG